MQELNMQEPLKDTNLSIAEEVKNVTGFILEHKVATKLEALKWNVIHNRYYLDDFQPLQREMDLVAYKMEYVDNIRVFTTLLISCKKSTFKDWIFLTRNAKGMKSNVKSMPFVYWSNVRPLNFQFDSKKGQDIILGKNDAFKTLKKLYDYKDTVFAFREYDRQKTKNRLENDTAIFDSIITLLKSQAYELDTLPVRREGVSCYYNFNLLTIADVEKFLELKCNDEEITEKEISRINYINRFIIAKKEHHARIEFIKYAKLDNALQDYEHLHSLNKKIVADLYNDFFAVQFRKSYSARSIIIQEFGSKLLNSLRWACYDKAEYTSEDFKTLYLSYNEETAILEIACTESQNLTNFLNSDPRVNKETSEWLLLYCKYTEQFVFQVDLLPF
ncbi:hypothetical protein [Pedobacter sp. SYSU D00535]|uniref:hypothetical protein n=1 Tax=Pedobacter sp. SYSU D00535 TaxID=2810308 RepID=UPI001A96AB88|nr:hypothetical protein [Pedobacter sp. SYSU D00535]